MNAADSNEEPAPGGAAGARLANALVLLFGLFLYLFQLDAEPLWWDELLSLRDSQDLSTLFGHQANRPLYYLVLWLWRTFTDDTTLLLRLPSVLFGVGSLYAMQRLGAQVLGRWQGVIAGLLLALSPLLLNHSQEVRMYSMAVFFSLAGSAFATRALDQGRGADYLGWLVCRLLGGLVTPLLWLLLPADLIAAHRRWSDLLSLSRRLWPLTVVLVLIAAILGPPLLGRAWRTTARVGQYGKYPKPGPVLVVAELTQLSVYWPLKHLAGEREEVHDLPSRIKRDGIVAVAREVLSSEAGMKSSALIVFYMLVSALLAFLLLYGGLTQPDYRTWQVVCWAVVPLLVMLAISWTRVPVWKSRYLIGFSPYLLLLVARGYFALGRRSRKLAIALAVLHAVAALVGLYHYYETPYRIFNDVPS